MSGIALVLDPQDPVFQELHTVLTDIETRSQREETINEKLERCKKLGAEIALRVLTHWKIPLDGRVLETTDSTSKSIQDLYRDRRKTMQPETADLFLLLQDTLRRVSFCQAQLERVQVLETKDVQRKAIPSAHLYPLLQSLYQKKPQDAIRTLFSAIQEGTIDIRTCTVYLCRLLPDFSLENWNELDAKILPLLLESPGLSQDKKGKLLVQLAQGLTGPDKKPLSLTALGYVSMAMQLQQKTAKRVRDLPADVAKVHGEIEQGYQLARQDLSELRTRKFHENPDYFRLEVVTRAIYPKQRYQEALKSFKASCNQFSAFSKFAEQKFKEFFNHTFLEPVFALIGFPPCNYDIRVLGSFGRGEIYLNSEKNNELVLLVIYDGDNGDLQYLDLLCAAIIEIFVSVQDKPAYESLRSLGWMFQDFFIKLKIQHVDHRGIDDLWVIARASPFPMPAQSFSLHQTKGSTLFEQYVTGPGGADFFSEALLKFKKNNHGVYGYPLLHETAVPYLLGVLAYHFKINANNILDVIDALVRCQALNQESGSLLKESIEMNYPHQGSYNLEKRRFLIQYPFRDCLIAIFSENKSPTEVFNSLDLVEVAFREFTAPLSPLERGNLVFLELGDVESASQSMRTVSRIYAQYQLTRKAVQLSDLFALFQQYTGDLKAFITTVAEHLVATDAPLERHEEIVTRLSRNPLLQLFRRTYFETLKAHGKRKRDVKELKKIPLRGAAVDFGLDPKRVAVCDFQGDRAQQVSDLKAKIHDQYSVDVHHSPPLNPFIFYGLQFNPELFDAISLCNSKEVTSNELSYIAKRAHNLKSLYLGYLSNLDTLGERKNPLEFPLLESLNLVFCVALKRINVVTPSLKILGGQFNFSLKKVTVMAQSSAIIDIQNSSNPVHIKRKHLTDREIVSIKDKYRLAELDLSDCSEITDGGIYRVPINIETLILRGCRSLKTPLLFNPNLNSMDLSACAKLDWVNLVGHIHLVELDLSDNQQLNDFNLYRQLIAVDSDLHTLGLSHCNGITDEALAKLNSINSLRESLRILRLNKFKHLTDQGLSHLSDFSLEQLSLSCCRGITDSGVRHLRAIKTLKVVNLKGCDQVTQAAVDLLRKTIPGLRVIF